MKLLAFLPFFLHHIVTYSQTFVDSRDGNEYPVIQLGELNWMASNLRYQTDRTMRVPDSLTELTDQCGEFYLLEDIEEACPDGWRLPTEEELRPLIKASRRHKINLSDSLDIPLCGRIDAGKYARPGEQSTFWIDAQNNNGHLLHWHVFGDRHELHSHNVVQARRQFPIRCVQNVE